MEGKKTHLDIPDDDTDDISKIAISDKHLLITALESGFTTIPMPILETMFEKANRLLEIQKTQFPNQVLQIASSWAHKHSPNSYTGKRRVSEERSFLRKYLHQNMRR